MGLRLLYRNKKTAKTNSPPKNQTMLKKRYLDR